MSNQREITAQDVLDALSEAVDQTNYCNIRYVTNTVSAGFITLDNGTLGQVQVTVSTNQEDWVSQNSSQL